jgi:hypothetical protein
LGQPIRAVEERTPLQILIEKRELVQQTYSDGLKQVHDATMKLGKLEERKVELKKAEEQHWENMMAVQATKKGGTVSAEEKAKVDDQIRAATGAAHQASVNLAAVEKIISKATLQVSNLVSFTDNLEDELGELNGQIDQLIVESSFIQPQQLFTTLPSTLESVVTLKHELPCVFFGRFWADMAMVNLPCGYFLHPSCMFKICLSKDPKCSNCTHVLGGVWMGQWGFSTNSESMQASIAAHNAAIASSGWDKPLNPKAAKKKVKEVRDYVMAYGSSRYASVDTVDNMTAVIDIAKAATMDESDTKQSVRNTVDLHTAVP